MPQTVAVQPSPRATSKAIDLAAPLIRVYADVDDAAREINPLLALNMSTYILIENAIEVQEQRYREETGYDERMYREEVERQRPFFGDDAERIAKSSWGSRSLPPGVREQVWAGAGRGHTLYCALDLWGDSARRTRSYEFAYQMQECLFGSTYVMSSDTYTTVDAFARGVKEFLALKTRENLGARIIPVLFTVQRTDTVKKSEWGPIIDFFLARFGDDHQEQGDMRSLPGKNVIPALPTTTFGGLTPSEQVQFAKQFGKGDVIDVESEK